jgi:hypothetical protein
MSVAALKERALTDCFWQSHEVTTIEEFETMNTSVQVADMTDFKSDAEENILTGMWMLFWAEYFDSEE